MSAVETGSIKSFRRQRPDVSLVLLAAAMGGLIWAMNAVLRTEVAVLDPWRAGLLVAASVLLLMEAEGAARLNWAESRSGRDRVFYGVWLGLPWFVVMFVAMNTSQMAFDFGIWLIAGLGFGAIMAALSDDKTAAAALELRGDYRERPDGFLGQWGPWAMPLVALGVCAWSVFVADLDDPARRYFELILLIGLWPARMHLAPRVLPRVLGLGLLCLAALT